MRALWNRLWQRMRLFRLVEDGVAAVEFALVLPVMLMLYIGAVEASALISMDRKLQTASGALGDLVSRSDGTIPAATLKDYFTAAAGIMTPHSTTELRQVVTLVNVRANGTTNVVWSRQYYAGNVTTGTKHPAGRPFNGLPAPMIAVALDNFVVVAEASYAYPPLYGFAFDRTINLYRENFFVPRFRSTISIN